MTIEDKLKGMIIDEYGSMIEFSKQIDMPNPTLSSILTRGIKKASISNIIKICKALQISADELANDRIVHVSHDHPHLFLNDIVKMIDFMRDNPEQYSDLEIDSILLSEDELEMLLNGMSMAVGFIREKRLK